MVGRPTVMTEEVKQEMLRRLADGETLTAICRDDHMPVRSTVNYLMSQETPEAIAFSNAYMRARVQGMQAMADDLLEISDNASNDWMEKNDPDNPGYDLNGEHVQRSRLRVDSRKFLMAKIAPHVFGDKTSVEVSGKDGGPIKTEGPSDYETARRVAMLLAKGAQQKSE